MKKVLLYCLFVCLSHSLWGQNWQNDLESQVEEALSTLDYSEVSTGILYDKIPTYYPFYLNDGTYIADSITVMESNFFFMYGMLDKGHTGTSAMLPVADFLTMSKSLAADEDMIHLSVLHYQYNRFKDYALTQNLLTYQNDHFYDVANRPESPYTENTLFAATAFRHEAIGKQVKFHLATDHIFSNIENRDNDFEVNFDDGNGWQNLLLNHNLTVNYPDTGLVF